MAQLQAAAGTAGGAQDPLVQAAAGQLLAGFQQLQAGFDMLLQTAIRLAEAAPDT